MTAPAPSGLSGEGIVIEGLHKRYGDTVALGGLDITAKPGEILGIAGPNGSGKSTMVKTLAGEVIADRGRILLDGAERDAADLAAQVTIVHQEPQVFLNLTVAENLARLHLRGSDGELRTWLGQLGLPFRPCRGDAEAESSCVVATDELPEWPSLRSELTGKLGSRLTLQEGIFGLSVVGKGLPPDAAAQALETARQSGVEVQGVETSPRRITLLVAESRATRLTAALHRTFIEPPAGPREDLPG